MRWLFVLLAACGRIGFDPAAAVDGGAGHDGPIAPRGQWQSVGVGANHTCAITDAGALWCWGFNYDGQLGLGDTTVEVPPTQVGTATWREVHPGAQSTCGIQTDDTLWCWGGNEYGQLGYGALGDRVVAPSQVDAATWLTVAVGAYFVCGLRTDRSLLCWGLDDRGQLGSGAMTDLPRPTKIAAGPFATVTAGIDHACAVDMAGIGTCWGSGADGKLGIDSSTDHPSAQIVNGGHTWMSIVASMQHTCGLTTDGTAWCWGQGGNGSLGVTPVASSQHPVQVMGPPLASLALGDSHTCGLTTANALYCWGATDRGAFGPLGVMDQFTPIQIAQAIAVGAGGNTTCYIDEHADLSCSGDNSYGQTGQPPGEVHVPRQSDTRSDWSAIFAHDNEVCALDTAKHAWCWGANYAAQIGDGTFRARQHPVDIATGLVGLAIGGSSVIALAGTERFGWGSAGIWQHTIPTDLGGAQAIVVGAGDSHDCYVTPAGTATCTGDDTRGQIGNGAFQAQNVTFTQPGSWRTIGAFVRSTCGIQVALGKGDVYCWGDNTGGQIGQGATAMVAVPAKLAVPGDATAVAVGYNHGCALASGAIYCWGDNYYGELGDGTGNGSATPVRAGTRSDYTQLAVGDTHTCAIASDHTLWCWGHADEGQLGLPLAERRTTPAQVGADTDWSSVAAAIHLTCAVKLDGTRWCFGYNQNGELGDDHGWVAGFLPLP